MENKLNIYDNYSTGVPKNIPLDYLEIEPLKLECQHFVSCCETGKKARSDGENGLTVVKIFRRS